MLKKNVVPGNFYITTMPSLNNLGVYYQFYLNKSITINIPEDKIISIFINFFQLTLSFIICIITLIGYLLLLR